ncbi:GSCOCG00009983001-RA-CDS, partial [Cotesia congregata]
MWNEVDEIFEKLETPKIKFIIGGVVVPDREIWSSRLTHKTPNGQLIEYYDVPSTLETMETWFRNNTHDFEALFYDMFVYMSKYQFKNPAITMDGSFFNYIFDQPKCTNIEESDNDWIARSGGLVWKEHEFALNAAQLIAMTLGIPLDDISKCGNTHIMG